MGILDILFQGLRTVEVLANQVGQSISNTSHHLQVLHRSRGEYQMGHIPGALSVPLEEIDLRMAELPKDREVVAYCRGAYCVLAVEAVERFS